MVADVERDGYVLKLLRSDLVEGFVQQETGAGVDDPIYYPQAIYAFRFELHQRNVGNALEIPHGHLVAVGRK